MRLEIFSVLSLFVILSYFLSQWKDAFYALFAIAIILFLIALRDIFQSKRTILKNFPILGHFRYGLEAIRPEIQQYFIEAETDGKPIARTYRSLIYQRSKKTTETIPFGTQLDVYATNYEWIKHSIYPSKVDEKNLRVTIGENNATKPYSASILNISAMSYGSLSKTAVLALSKGAKLGGFFHNTGEGGISPYHLEGGGDLVWQIGTGYFGCRDENGNFDSSLFKKNASHENVKMIELKISQGAKPAHGGILPGVKVNKEIAEIRNVPIGKTVYSPSFHSSFSNSEQMLNFVKNLRDLSGGKPVGIKFCLGRTKDFIDICDAMKKTKIYMDYIAIDGGEGGTGAAPLELTNVVGYPLLDGLKFIDEYLKKEGLRDKVKIIASGKVFSAFHIYKLMALGADLVSSARGMMLALGCIQALRCNTNHCPTGVATTLPKFYKGLDVKDKSVRVANFHDRTIEAFKELLEVAGYEKPSDIEKSSIAVRSSSGELKDLAQM